MTKRLPILTLVVLLLALSSCKKEYADPVDFKYEYFPLESGSIWIYDAVRITIDDFDDTKDTIHTQIKEFVADTSIDLEGDEYVEIWRYERHIDSTDWGVRKVWWAKRTATRAEKIEENLRFIKMVFPPKAGTEWNGNAHILINNDNEFYENWEYEYLEVDGINNVFGVSYDSTVNILQVDDENLLLKRYSQEIYAKNIGMVYKEEIDLESKTEFISDPWTNEKKWLKGHILKMNLVSYTE